MSWLRLTIDTTANQVELISDLLERFDATAVSFSPVSGEPVFGDSDSDPGLWRQTSVSALLDSEIDVDILLACLRNRIGTEHIFRHGLELLQEQEWTETCKEGTGPVLFGDKICVCPSWVKSSENFPVTIIIDPGLAFGTGRHTTTALCLEWLADNDIEGRLVIDYGCGSGILALAAAGLGAELVYALDIDPQALFATRANAAKNGLEKTLKISPCAQADLPEVDILVANILLNPLLDLAPDFSKFLKPDGQIVMSGILAVQAQDCLDRYDRWFRMDQPEYRNEWAILHGYRKNPDMGAEC